MLSVKLLSLLRLTLLMPNLTVVICTVYIEVNIYAVYKLFFVFWREGGIVVAVVVAVIVDGVLFCFVLFCFVFDVSQSWHP